MIYFFFCCFFDLVEEDYMYSCGYECVGFLIVQESFFSGVFFLGVGVGCCGVGFKRYANFALSYRKVTNRNPSTNPKSMSEL